MNDLKVWKRIALLACIIACALMAVSCSGSKDGSAAGGESSSAEDPVLMECPVEHEHEFGGVYIKKTIDEFNDLGFEYGDSIDIRFSNGYEMLDQPYYNGYYTLTGDSLLVAYPGYPYIRAGINNGDCLWDLSGLTEEDTATITMNEKGKYLDIQKARDIHYTDERGDYESDEEFANFRCVQVGDIAPDRLYRSASPCDNQHNRATYVNDLIEAAGVKCILDLADDDDKIKGYMEEDDFSCAYFKSLYDDGKVLPVALNSNYGSMGFRAKLAKQLVKMSEQDGPYLVHCMEGKDRTGFVCILLEALCGADYNEVRDDYMKTYYNYYDINEEQDKDRYKTIVTNVFEPMIDVIFDDQDIDYDVVDLQYGAQHYLRLSGMTDEQIEDLRTALTE